MELNKYSVAILGYIGKRIKELKDELNETEYYTDTYRQNEIMELCKKWDKLYYNLLDNDYSDLLFVTYTGEFIDLVDAQYEFDNLGRLLKSIQNSHEYYGTPDHILLIY